jgi:phosphatidate phosphatase PAH1
MITINNVVDHFFRINELDKVEEVDEFAIDFTPNLSFRITF